MDYKEKYLELLEKNRELERELLALRSEKAGDRQHHGKRENKAVALDEILEMVNIYLAVFSIGEDRRFYILELNRKAEEVESILNKEAAGKYIGDTLLAKRHKLLELLHHVQITGEAHKLAASETGDDTDGYYMGFLLSSGNIAVTWEEGNSRKILEEFHKQGAIFEKFADMLPEIVYEVDLSGNISYSNQQGLEFFGYTREDLANGIKISTIFPETHSKMVENLLALKMPGHSKLKLTGQIGEVMRESVDAALSYIRARAPYIGVEEDFFKDTDVHVHVPSGAIPKDGPSAGVAMLTSLVSLFSDRTVKKGLAMTGEITLRGHVLPVGGIKDKVLAAHRAGIKEVILPAQNAKDLEDIPANVKDELQFDFVDRMDEVLEIAFAHAAAIPQKQAALATP